MDKKRTLIIRAGLIILIIILAVLMIKEDLFGVENMFAYSNIEKNKDLLMNADNNIDDLKHQIESLEDELYDSQKNKLETKAKSENLPESILDEDLSLHLPSILIILENLSEKHKVGLEILYNDIELLSEYKEKASRSLEETDSPSNGDDEDELDLNDSNENSVDEDELREDENMDDLDEYDNGEGVGGEFEEIEDENKEETDDLEDKNKEDDDEKSEKENYQFLNFNSKLPEVEGLSITLAPIQLAGDFVSVRAFIRELDELDYIEPIYINIDSTGSAVETNLILAIMHDEN